MASTEAAELRLVSSIRYKLANSSGDEKKLSETLATHLVPLMAKAGSPHKAVRDATFQAFISVNNFVKPAGVAIPVAGLLRQYKSATSPMVKQLDLNLIKQGLARLDQDKRRELLPVVVQGISQETNVASAAGFFNIFLRLLLEISIPGRGTKEDIGLRETIGLSDAADARYVAAWLGKLFLLRQDIALAAEDEIESLLRRTPTGLTKEDVAFLRNNNPHAWRPGTPNSLSLPECKTKAIGFLGSGAFLDDERHLPTIYAAGSADSRIATVADDILKRSKVDLEDEALLKALFKAHNQVPAAQRIQIMRLLSKSMKACTLHSEVVDAVLGDFMLTSPDAAEGEPSIARGLEALRLHQTLLAFLAWIARNGSTTSERSNGAMGGSLVFILKDFILKQGWPEPISRGSQSQFQDEQRLRANAYETIGTLSRGSTFESKAKETLLKWLFDSLVSDPSTEVVVHIESALSSMMGLFKSQATDEHRDLEILLLEYMTLTEGQGLRSARHVAARFANNCLPYSDVKARWIDILALSGGSTERRDVLEEGQRGLDPWWATKLQPDSTLTLPDWSQMITTFFDQTPREIGDSEMAVDQTSKYPLFTNERLRAFPIALRFVKQNILLQALGELNIEVDWDLQLENKLQNDLKTRDQIRTFLATADSVVLGQLLHASLDGLRDHPETGAEEAVTCLAELLAHMPSTSIPATLAQRSGELLEVLPSNNQKVRHLAAKVFAILAPLDDNASHSIAKLRSFVESAGTSPPAALSAQYQGSIASLAGYFSRAALYGKDVDEAHLGFLKGRFLSALDRSDAAIKDSAIEAMNQLWSVGLCFPDSHDGFKHILDALFKLAEANNEKAIRAIGRLAIPAAADQDKADKQEDSVTSVLTQLFKLFEIKRTEVHFATGEALAAVVARWDSDAVQLGRDVQPQGSGESDVVQTLRKRPGRIENVLEKLINDCKTTKPSLLKASGIWLFCIIQYCSHLPEIQARLRECQVAFMRLLTGRDELVQETASRGLALVYERGDESLKGELVKDLVASFTGTKTQLKVDDDTELFDAGALPTGEGKSVTSYKDIISLANEVGDQSLVYKFMALATNAATWTARSAFGRFGLSNILSEADLDPKIYPALFRYRFDPNSNVRRSMDDIWKAVVKDSSATIDAHFDAIMTDLLKSILDGKEWRVREASCAAVADLIYGQQFTKYEKYYTDIWRVTLRVIDDQKASVRAAALKLCMGLSKSLVTQLQEHNSSGSAKAMITQVLPFLLSDKGVENSVEEVKVMAITTVLDVVKHGGETLKPFIPTIIIHFLGLLSTIEPQQINYYYQRVSEEDREGLDKLRSSAATRSPLFECITNCLRFADDGVLKELAPQLVQTTKSALGMQTKIGCSEVLSTLALRHSILLPPYNGLFLKAMETQVLDRNNEVNRAYAKSAAYLLRTASPETRERFTNKLTLLYMGAEEDARRQKVADAVLAIAKVSPDAFNDLESRLLPFAYLGKHDTDEYVSEVFEEVWSQHAGGSHTVKRFIPEIVDFVTKALDTSKWALQHGGALAIASMVTALSSAAGKDGQFGEKDLATIWPVLDKALALKTFKGKEKLVTAYPLFVRHGRKFWANDKPAATQTKKIALREAKRNNDEYRPFAFEALGGFASARDDLDMYEEVVGIVSEYLSPDSKETQSDTERRTTQAAVKAVLNSYSRERMKTDCAAVLQDIVATMEDSKATLKIARDAWFSGSVEVLANAGKSGSTQPTSAHESLVRKWLSLVVADEADVILESQRLDRAKALGAVVKAVRKGVFGPSGELEGVLSDMRTKMSEMASAERSLDVQKALRTAAE
ncbi:proteasome component ECM29 [Microdochium bolleyi]|uniref:Proteasome component ECM29 n=1 Tax=Microdochium bolleyi TaxID=196109 RepID=A0A136JG08_9PEZI|nr:proteasome component ECM29 [Microdochium bolleyi]